MFELRQILSEEDWRKTRLVIIGGCRGQDDWKLLQDLKDLSKHFSVEDNVEFHPNLPFKDLLAEFGKATSLCLFESKLFLFYFKLFKVLYYLDCQNDP